MFDEPVPSTDRRLDPAVVFDRAPEALLAIEAGVVIRVNERARELLGEDLLGERIDVLIEGWRRDVTEPFEAEIGSRTGKTDDEPVLATIRRGDGDHRR